MVRIRALIKSFLLPKRKVRLGLSRAPSGIVHALVSHSRNGRIEIISAGSGVPALARLMVPATACGDLDATPVYLKSAEIGKTDPEHWVDQHELDVIPQGAAPDTIVNEYTVHEGTIYSATVAKDALAKAAECPDANLKYAFLSAPLWNVGRLYGQSIATPFVLWRLSKEGSVFGLVRKGRCEKIVHSWIGADDVSPDNSQSVGDTIRLLCDGEAIASIYLFSPDKNFALPAGFQIPGYEIGKIPDMGELPAHCHEAYANACFGPEGDHNFAPFTEFQKTRKRESQAGRLFTIVRFGLWLLIGSFTLLFCLDVGMRAIDSRYRGPMETLQSQELVVKAAEKRRDALMKHVSEKAKFSTERSRATTLLADLQTIFPDDAWAENLTIASIDKNIYKCDLSAFAIASSKVSEVLDAIREIRGITDARLVYSEQVLLPDKSKAIRFKITYEWR